MSNYLSDDEQVALIKKWWQRYGQWLLNIVLVIALGYAGWTWYDRHQLNISAQASQTYQLMIETIAAENDAQAQAYAQALRQDFPKTVYAAPAAFWLAKSALSKEELTAEDFSTAQNQLEWVVKNSRQVEFQQMAMYRLAQIHKHQENYSEALAQLARIDNAALQTLAKELSGDIYQLQGEYAKARMAYADALQDLPVDSGSPLLEMKLHNVPA